MIHIYTGNGKGKTTAAMGLALRAAGAGLKVYIGQFIKGKQASELKALKGIRNIKVEQFGNSCFIKKVPSKMDRGLAEKGLKRIDVIISAKLYNLVILDEITVALKLGLLDLNSVTNIIKNAPKSLELVLTGRYANPKIINLADLVSEIREVKHYFRKGVKARKGIEY
jgi:cob(I)alamin adenosyltransferase